MSSIPAQLLADLEGAVTAPCYLFRLALDTPLYLHSRDGVIELDGQDYSGGAVLDSLGEVVGGGLESVISINNGNYALTDIFTVAQGRRVDIWLGNGAGPFSTADVAHLFSGIIDKVSGLATTKISLKLSTDGRLGKLSPNIRIRDIFDWITPRNTQLNWGCERKTIEGDVGGEIIPILMGPVSPAAIEPLHAVHNDTLYIMYVWGLGEIEAFDADYLNNEAVPTGVTVRHYRGTANQGVDPGLAIAIPGYADTGRKTIDGVDYSVAYSVVEIPHGEIDVVPNFVTELRGLKLHDPRSGLTEYTDNPALMTAAWCESEQFGQGRTALNVAAAADSNDELLNGKPRRSAGFIIRREAAVTAITEKIAQAAGLYLSATAADSVELIPNRPGASIGTITRIRKGSLQLNPVDQRQIPSRVTCKYAITDVYPHTQGVVEALNPDGIGRPSPLERAWIKNDSSLAQREAEEFINRRKHAGMSITFEGYSDLAKYKRGDIATLNAKAWQGDIRILRVVSLGKNKHRVIAQQYSALAYSDSTVTSTVSTPPDLPSKRTISAPIIIEVRAGDAQRRQSSDGHQIYNIIVELLPANVNVSDRLYFKEIKGEYEVDGEWRPIRITKPEDATANHIAEITSVEDGVSYPLRFWSVNCSSAESVKVTTSATALKKDIAPPQPNSITGYSRANGSRIVSVSNPTMPDDYTSGTEIQCNYAGWVDLGPRIDTRDSRTISADQIPTGAFKLRARNIDQSGNESEWVESAVINFGADTTTVDTEHRDNYSNGGTTFKNHYPGINTGIQTADNAARYNGNAFSSLYPQIDNDAKNSPVGNSRITDVNGSKIAGNSIVESKIQGQLSDAKLAALSGWKIHGNSVDESKIYGQLSDSKLASIAGTKVHDGTLNASSKLIWRSIDESRLGDNVVVERVISANAIYAYHIVGGQITGDKIAANSISTSHIQAGAITANDITSGTFYGAGGGILDLDSSTTMLRSANGQMALYTGNGGLMAKRAFTPDSSRFFFDNGIEMAVGTVSIFPSAFHLKLGSITIDQWVNNKIFSAITAHETKTTNEFAGYAYGHADDIFSN